MVVNISAVLLLGGMIALLLRYRVLRWLDVALSATFGFLLAGTAIGPWLHAALGWLITTIGTIHT
jgi:hypothetical protein